MSKNIRKNISAASAAIDELADRRADQAHAKLELRDHEFTTTENNEANAPCGNAPSTAEQVSGTTVFDIIPRLSSVGQITALRSIANGAIISAVYAARDAVTVTDEDDEFAARVRMAQQAELYSYAAAELQTLASTPYDLPMSIDQAVEFAESSAAAQKPDKRRRKCWTRWGSTRPSWLSSTRSSSSAQCSARPTCASRSGTTAKRSSPK